MAKLTTEQIEKLKDAGFGIAYTDPKTREQILFWQYQYGLGIKLATGDVFGIYGGKEKNRWRASEQHGHLCPASWEMLTKLSNSLRAARDILMPERAAQEERTKTEEPDESPQSVASLPSERVSTIRREENASYGNGTLFLNQAAATLLLPLVMRGYEFGILSKDKDAVYLQVSQTPAANTVRLREVKNKSESSLRASGKQVFHRFFPENESGHVTMFMVELLKDGKTIALKPRTT